MGQFGQCCARRQRRQRLSRGANAASPLPALAAGQVEASEQTSPSLQPRIPPSQPGRGGSGGGLRRAALLPLHPCALPRHHWEGKLLLNPTSAPPWDQEDQELLPRAETFTIAFGLAAEILLQWGGRRSGGSVPGLAAKLSSGLHGASKHVRRSGPAW